MTAKGMKELIVARTLIKHLDIGKRIRLPREAGDDPLIAVADLLGGWILFKGRIEKKEWEDRDGYMYGDYLISGRNTFRIWFKNENHITWLDDKPYVTSPDIIEIVEMYTAEPITNTDPKEGQLVAVISAKKREIQKRTICRDVRT